jgi:hypothetical protein
MTMVDHRPDSIFFFKTVGGYADRVHSFSFFLTIITTSTSVAVFVGNVVGAIVRVDLTTELDGSLEPLGHDLKAFIFWNINREEAGMGLRKSICTHVASDSDFVSVSKSAGVVGELDATPDELQVLPSLVLSERLEHLPEHLDPFGLTSIGDGLERGSFDIFGSTGSELDFFPGQEGQDGDVKHVADALLEPLHLLLVLGQFGFGNQLHELLVIGMCDRLVFSSRAELHWSSI